MRERRLSQIELGVTVNEVEMKNDSGGEKYSGKQIVVSPTGAQGAGSEQERGNLYRKKIGHRIVFGTY